MYSFRLPEGFKQPPLKLPTDKDYKRMIAEIDVIIKPNMDALSRIDGIVSFGGCIARDNFREVRMYFTFRRGLDLKGQAGAIERVMALPGMTIDNVEFKHEAKKLGKRTSYGNERIRPDQPR